MPPPRRFRSFALRTLMVLVTASGAFFGWVVKERSMVAERKAALDRWARNSKSFQWVSRPPANRAALGLPPISVTWLRKRFGDLPIDSISISTEHEQHEFDLAQRLFPEAKVQWAMIRGDTPDDVFPLPTRDHAFYVPSTGQPVLIEPEMFMPAPLAAP